MVVNSDVVNVVPHLATENKSVVFLLISDSIEHIVGLIPVFVVPIFELLVLRIVIIGQIGCKMDPLVVIPLLCILLHRQLGLLIENIGQFLAKFVVEII